MKNKFKQFVSLMIALAMVLSISTLNVFSITEEDGETINVSANNVTVEKSAETQTVYISLYMDKAAEVSNFDVAVNINDAENVGVTFGGGAELSVTAMTGTINLTAGAVEGGISVGDQTAQHQLSLNAELNGYVLVKIPFSIPANKTGSVTVKFSELNIADFDNASGYELADTTTTATITVTEPSVPEEPTAAGYAATIAGAATNDNPVRVGAANPIKVNVGSNKNFAATEMTITYPATLVSFNKDASTLGTATITDDANGTLTIADYGADKIADAANYVLAFNVKSTPGTAEFKITKAGFGTGDSAVNANLTSVSTENLGSVSIEIKKAQVTVTLPDDGLFYAESTTIDAGSDFTFYPEQTTGGYYTYDLPEATVGGVDVPVTEIKDGNGNVIGWKIANVEGDVVIAAGARTPAEYGNVDYTGTGSDKISNQTEKAVYLTPIQFTIPADVQPGVESGVEYTVAATIGGVSYTFGDPTVDESTGARTYTIPGDQVKGAVAVTVTATVLDADKVTVSIGGNGANDGAYKDAEPGASIQIDKETGSATLTVDTTSGLNKGYEYDITTSAGTLKKNDDGTYTISGLTANATITIQKTIKVEGVKNTVEIGGQEKNFVSMAGGKQMWLIQLPNHVDNTDTVVYKYNGQEMFWSADHNNYVIVVTTENNTAPAITADMFTLETVTKTPTLAPNSNAWDVNKSGTVDANDAQLIWNMYNNVYAEISNNANGATAEKFILADANDDGVLNTDDAVVIINKILNIQ